MTWPIELTGFTSVFGQSRLRPAEASPVGAPARGIRLGTSEKLLCLVMASITGNLVVKRRQRVKALKVVGNHTRPTIGFPPKPR